MQWFINQLASEEFRPDEIGILEDAFDTVLTRSGVRFNCSKIRRRLDKGKGHRTKNWFRVAPATQGVMTNRRLRRHENAASAAVVGRGTTRPWRTLVTAVNARP